MSPENLAQAAKLHGQLAEAENLLGRITSQQPRARPFALTLDVARSDSGRGIMLSNDGAVPLLEALIATTKDNLRALGVVFEPVDAVMPELRDRLVDDVDPGSREPATTEPDHLTITITGPQGCGKTLVRDWLIAGFDVWNDRAPVIAASVIGTNLRKVVNGKQVTVVAIDPLAGPIE